MSKFYIPGCGLSGVSKKVCVILISLMGIFGAVKAQISVTATAATLGPTPYSSLKAAFDAINAGTHQGVIDISIINNSTELSQAVLNNSGAPSSYTAVHIKPTGTFTISGNISTSLIKLNGADSVTIDGAIAVGGTTRNLTFSNSSNSTTSGVIWVASQSVTDGATRNIIKNCNVIGNAPTTTLAGIVQSSGVTLGGVAETANSNNTYNNNAVTAAMYGIGVVGANGNEDANSIISGNTVGTGAPGGLGLGHVGIFIAQQKNVLVTGNTIAGVTSTAGNFTFQTSGIFIGGTIVSGGLIEKNKISNVKIASVWGCNGIQLNASTAVTNLVIANNFIWDVAAGGFGGIDTIDDNGYGIAVNAGGGYKIYFNSVDLSTNETSPGMTAAMWIGQGIAASSLDIRDNIFANRQTTSSRFAIYSNSANTIFSSINYNDYYSLDVLGFLGSNRATIANWQTATGQDANSIAVNPVFTSTSDLHLFGTSPLDGFGTPIAGITTDIDGDARGATPDMGADEFTPPNCTNPVIGNFSATGTITDICASGSSVLSASGYSYGVGITYQWQYSTTSSTGPWTNLAGQTNPLNGNTGTISVTTYYQLVVTCTLPSGSTGHSLPVTVTVNNPAVSGTTPGTRCGVGTVNLAAVGPNLKWYTAATGGTAIGTGSPFTTPVITSSTFFYVSSTSGGTVLTGGKPGTAGPDGGYNGTDAGLVFDATQQFVIDSVKLYPQAAGQITIQLLNSAGTLITSATPPAFTGATSTGIYVTLGFTVPIGTGYRLVVSQNTSSIAIWRDFGGNSFPYSLGAAGSITGGWLGANITTYYFFYDWHITTGCESTRTPVLATVTTPPAFTSFSPNAGPPRTICSGGSITLNATGGGYTTVNWLPGNLPNGTVVSPAVTTTYTVTANIPGGCRRDSIITITVNATPTTLIDSVTNAAVCPNTPIRIGTSGGLIPNQNVIPIETFETFPFTNYTLTNNGGGTSNVNLSQNTTYFQQGAASMWLTHGDFSNGAVQMTNPINLNGFLNPSLTFYHIAGLEAAATNHYDVGYVEYATVANPNEGDWTKFPTTAYSGGATLVGGFVGFDNTSYSDWDAQFSGGTSTPGTAPATSMWKQETINLTTWQTQPNFRIRFHLITDVSIQYYGWLIDNVRISGTGQACITWSPTTNLYTDAGHGTNISGAGCYSTVYYWVAGATPVQTYTATATSGVNCSSTATTTISASSLSASVSIVANPAGAICSGTCVTFTATPTNGGAPPGYNWKVNGSSVSGGSQVGMNVFTICNLVNGDLVTCDMSVNPNVGACIVATVVTSNTINYTGLVNPTPTANNITGATGSTVCTGTPNLLTETAVGTIATYQWYQNTFASPVGGNSSTYSATAPSTYFVVVTSNLGCKDTSNNYVVTQPTYTVTATAGPNGTISPSGAISVNCGDDVTFTITPNLGYSIQDVTVNGTSVGPVGTYTISNVTADSTIHATFNIAGCATPATAIAGSDATICSNQNYTISGASVGGSATSGTWSTSGTGTFMPSVVFGVATTYIPSQADSSNTTVNLTLTTDDPPGSCIPSTSTIALTIKPAPAVNITGSIGLCSVGATTTYLVADTSATAVAVDITSFAWTHAGPVGTNNDSLFVSAGATGAYSVLVTASNGCTATDAVTVNMYPTPTVSIAGVGPICTDAGIDINATPSGGSGTFQPNGFLWYATPGPTLIPSATTSILTATSAATYTAYATDSHGCRSTVSNPVSLVMDNGPLNGNYTIGMGPASCTNYISFATAIKDLNNRGISGNVRFSVPAAYTEVAPSGGLILGGKLVAGVPILNNQTNGGLTITFLKSGVGVNPKITAWTPVGGNTPATAVPDGIFKLRGIDNVSIIQIDLAENPANSGNALMDYGYGLFRYSATDGANHNSIQGCTITLDKSNSIGAGGLMSDGATGIIIIGAVDTNAINTINATSVTGANSNNIFYGNTIENCHNGFWFSGFGAASPYTLGDTGNDIGGSSSATGNTIINFGNAGDATVASAVHLNNQWSANVSFNTIDNNNGAGVNSSTTLKGIYAVAAASANLTVSSNSISLKSTAAGIAVTGIDNGIGATSAGNTVTINNNTITGTGSGAWAGISNSATPATLSVIGNFVQNVVLAGTGTFSGFINSATSIPVVNLNNNVITGNTKQSTGTMNGITMGSNSSISLNLINNRISNNTIAGGGAACLFVGISASNANPPGTVCTATNNTIYDNSITGMTLGSVGTIYGYTNASFTKSEILTDNIIRKLFVTGAAGNTGLHVIRGFYINTTGTSDRSFIRNQVDSLYSNSAASSAITGIFSQAGQNVTIANNKVHSLWAGQQGTGAAFVKGISVNSGGSGVGNPIKIYNNMVSLDLTQAAAPAANGVLVGTNAAVANNAVAGIDIVNTGTATTSVQVYYNTIRLAGAGSGTGFGSSGFSITSGNGNIDLRNNIIANYMTAGGAGAGVSAAFRKTGGATHDPASNNNDFYTAQTATSPIYYNGAASATLAAYQLVVTPRDTLSINDEPQFVSIPLNDLHLNPGANCAIDGMGQFINGYPDDYDATLVRDSTAPDIGADEFDGTGGSGVWKGINTNWFDPKNWCGVVPTVTTDVTIPKRFSGNYPIILTATNAVCRNININQNAFVTINTGGQLSNTGSWLMNGTLTNNGTIELNGASNQAFPNSASTGTIASMTNLTANNPGGITIDKPITLIGVLKPQAGAITLNNVMVTLHSDASGTASVSALSGSSSFVYTGANAKFSVERFIFSGPPGNRTAWRFLAAPTLSTQTINQAWQEGAPPGVSGPSIASTGFGMQIVGQGGPALGFDIDNLLPSLKKFDSPSNTWVGVPGTLAPNTIQATDGYMAFVRGDRGSYQFGDHSYTTLRTQGQLRTGAVTVGLPNANVNQFISVANPYPCAIDFSSASTTKTGLVDVYYLWDPKLNLYGGYQTFTGPSYNPVPGGGSYGTGNKSIESGQAFLLYSNNSAATAHSVTMNEGSKSASNMLVTRVNILEKSLSTRLYLLDGAEPALYDGNRVDFDPAYSNTVDDNDARKSSNFGENIGILRNGNGLAVERRAEIVSTDTIFYNLGQLRTRTYRLEFTTENLSNPGLTAYLEDNYLHSSTVIDLSVVSTVDFTVNADVASRAADRFRLVFRQLGPVPVSFTSVTAYRQDRHIIVDWKVENEVSINHYEIERSTDSRHFSKLAEQVARGNGSGITLQYSQPDVNPFTGDNFYRIKSVGNSGDVKYSDVVRVNMAEGASIAIYPNPVKEDGIIKVSMINEPTGSYRIRLLSASGQVVLTRLINHEGANSVYDIDLKQASVSHGNYLIQVSQGNKVKTTSKIVY